MKIVNMKESKWTLNHPNSDPTGFNKAMNLSKLYFLADNMFKERKVILFYDEEFDDMSHAYLMVYFIQLK